MLLSWGDAAYIIFGSVLIGVSCLLNHLLRKSIGDKPEGSKTVISEIHASTSYGHQVFIFCACAPLVFRSIFGPIIPGRVVLLIKYSRYISGTVTLFTLGYGAVVKFGSLSVLGECPRFPIMTMINSSDEVVKRAINICTAINKHMWL